MAVEEPEDGGLGVSSPGFDKTSQTKVFQGPSFKMALYGTN